MNKKKLLGTSVIVLIIIFAFQPLMVTADNDTEEMYIVGFLKKCVNSLHNLFSESSNVIELEEKEKIKTTIKVTTEEDNVEIKLDEGIVETIKEDKKPNIDEKIIEETKVDIKQIEEPKEETGDETVVEEEILLTGDLNGDDMVNSKDEKVVEGFWGLEGPYQLKSPDLNGDNTVDIDDLFGILNAWGPCEIDCSADLNCDLIVDNRDECIIEGYWGMESEYILSNSPDLNNDGIVDIDDVFFVLAYWT